MIRLLFVALFSLLPVFGTPTEVRDWQSTSGHKATGAAIEVNNDVVKIKLETGKVVDIPLNKLSPEDQTFLSEHFKLNELPPANEVPSGEPADDLPYPLGKTTAELEAKDGYHYFLYLPESLEKGKKHPVIFVMNPSGGSNSTTDRYQAGAERNQWIIAVSKESTNGFSKSTEAIVAMIEKVQSSLPIDKKRMYLSGFSGGSRMAYSISQKYGKMAGLLPCGAGGEVGSRSQIVYGLCGSNCFNRSDMARSFEKVKSKGSVLRYFEGKHDWAESELIDDGITHLNGVFLSTNKSGYAEEYARYTAEVGKLISENMESKPTRAYMWADFMRIYQFTNSTAQKAHTLLEADPSNKLYIKGLEEIRQFAEKTYTKLPVGQWKADSAIAEKYLQEAPKYKGTEWEGILIEMAKDAQSY